MKVTKRILGKLLTVFCVINLLPCGYTYADAKTKMTKKSSKLENTTIKRLSIDADDCNISIEKTDGKKIICEYDKKRFGVSLNQKDENVTVKIDGLEADDDYDKECPFGNMEEKICTVYLPEDLKADTVEMTADEAGISMQYLPQADLSITGDVCSVGLREPDDFKYKISINLSDSSGTFHFPKEDLDEVCLKKNYSCAMSCPKELYDTEDKTDRRITLDLDAGSYTISTKKSTGKIRSFVYND